MALICSLVNQDRILFIHSRIFIISNFDVLYFQLHNTFFSNNVDLRLHYVNVFNGSSSWLCLFVVQCIVESVSIMDIICGEDPSYVYRAFPCIKALYGRLNSDLAYSRALIPIAQFYLNHSKSLSRVSGVSMCVRAWHLNKSTSMCSVVRWDGRSGFGGCVQSALWPLSRWAVQRAHARLRVHPVLSSQCQHAACQSDQLQTELS